MSPYQVLLILEFFPARLATLPYGLDLNVTKLQANLLTNKINKIIIIIIIKGLYIACILKDVVCDRWALRTHC